MSEFILSSENKEQPSPRLMRQYYDDIQSLVIKTKEGDNDSLYAIFTFYQPLIKASIARCIKKEAALKSYAEDMFGESFIVLKDLIRDYNPELSFFSYYLALRFDYYLLTRCKRTYLGINTSGNGIVELPINEDALQISHDPFNKNEFKQEMQVCIDQLKPDQQLVIEYYFYESLTQSEAAAKMGISQAAFSKKLKKTITDLKELYENFSNNFPK